MGRDAVGVRGIRLHEGDYVVGAAEVEESDTLLAITERGYGKRTPVEDYFRGGNGEPQKRGGSGMRGYQLTDKTGKLVSIKLVTGKEDLLLITDDGTMIRMDVGTVNVYGRSTQGVRLMRLDEGVKVISIALAEKEEESAEENAEEQPEE